MNSVHKTLIILVCSLMAFNAMGRERELTRRDNDSVAHALATIWSKSYINIAANDGKDIAKEYMRGVQTVLSHHIDSTNVVCSSADSSSVAFLTGLQQGLVMTQNIKNLEKKWGFKVDVKRMKHVFSNIEKGRPSGYSDQTAKSYLNWLMTNLAKEDYQIDGSAEFLLKTSQRPGVIKTPTGLLFEVITEGEGESPDENDMVYLRYECRLIDGKLVNKSDEKNNAIMTVNETIPGFSEGLQKMKIGGKYRLYIPSELGYGEEGSKSIPGGAAAIFDVELLDYRIVDADGNFGDSVLMEKQKQEQEQQQ